jgi:hypothetical protein
MRFTRDSIRALRPRLQAALDPVAKELGIQIKAGNAAYDPDGGTATVKVEMAVIGPDGTVARPEARVFQQLARLLGLQEDDLGKQFSHGGTKFRITGCAARSQKFPILAARVTDGKVFKFPVEAVARGLGRPYSGTPADLRREAEQEGRWEARVS